MPSIASQLETLAGIKSDIKAAIIDKGQTVGDDFSTYATAIGNIEGGGGSATLVTKTATTNGTYRASDDSADGYSEFTVAVPGSNLIDIEVTQNGYKYPSDYNPQPDGFSSVYVNCPQAQNEVTLYIRASAAQTQGIYDDISQIPNFSGDELPENWEWGIPQSQLTGNDVIGTVIVL